MSKHNLANEAINNKLSTNTLSISSCVLIPADGYFTVIAESPVGAPSSMLDPGRRGRS